VRETANLLLPEMMIGQDGLPSPAPRPCALTSTGRCACTWQSSFRTSPRVHPPISELSPGRANRRGCRTASRVLPCPHCGQTRPPHCPPRQVIRLVSPIPTGPVASALKQPPGMFLQRRHVGGTRGRPVTTQSQSKRRAGRPPASVWIRDPAPRPRRFSL
jgi:hypothetical protein